MNMNIRTPYHSKWVALEKKVTADNVVRDTVSENLTQIMDEVFRTALQDVQSEEYQKAARSAWGLFDARYHQALELIPFHPKCRGATKRWFSQHGISQ